MLQIDCKRWSICSLAHSMWNVVKAHIAGPRQEGKYTEIKLNPDSGCFHRYSTGGTHKSHPLSAKQQMELFPGSPVDSFIKHPRTHVHLSAHRPTDSKVFGSPTYRSPLPFLNYPACSRNASCRELSLPPRRTPLQWTAAAYKKSRQSRPSDTRCPWPYGPSQ